MESISASLACHALVTGDTRMCTCVLIRRTHLTPVNAAGAMQYSACGMWCWLPSATMALARPARSERCRLDADPIRPDTCVPRRLHLSSLACTVSIILWPYYSWTSHGRSTRSVLVPYVYTVRASTG